MMNGNIFLLYLLNLGFIGILPIVFFKKGRLSLRWWITASPFFLCSLFLIASFFGIAPLVTGYKNSWSHLLELISVVFSVGSIALIAFTLGTHRIPIDLWHQENDAPRHIVTYGAYQKIRHPFYAAFLLCLLGALIFSLQLGTLFTFVYGFIVMNYTAAKEEESLMASEFRSEYEEYIRQTGRFWPRSRGGSI